MYFQRSKFLSYYLCEERSLRFILSSVCLPHSQPEYS